MARVLVSADAARAEMWHQGSVRVLIFIETRGPSGEGKGHGRTVMGHGM